ncbi:hypothetical protein O181_023502 [Austropuccinia psidii MF-1]|uniref:SNF2 N-terminal domain-containing protein n=1 Tax=Austropuccinia psidii MF-1 TaxID=1389203 RepID=A0A9Q3CHH5_9BASI|nr:hypothetical protein [Austropuccinia psidii MF-1]
MSTFTPTSPTSNSTPLLYPTVFSLSSKQKLIQLPKIPNGQHTHNLQDTSPPGSTFNARHITTNKVVILFESLPTNTPLGGLLVDDMRLGKTINSIALIVTSKELLITNWKSEISKHAQAGPMQANIYHGPTSHSLSEAKILQCNIGITYYNTFTQEF